jgi:hypothetical protein
VRREETVSSLVAALRAALAAEGSGRTLGLMRILVALMVWARFADRFIVHPKASLVQLGAAACFYLFSTLMLLGQWSRLCTAVVAGVLLYGYHGRGFTSHNMQLLDLTVLMLVFTPLGAAYSLDRHWALQRAERTGRPVPSEAIPLWTMWLPALLLSSVYLSTFLNKTNLEFLSGERLEAIVAGHYTGSDYLDGALWSLGVQAFSVAVWLVEGALVVGLLLPRVRAWLMLAGAFMHLSFYALFRIYAFSVNMVMLYFAFVPPAQVAGAIDRLCGYSFRSGKPVLPDQATTVARWLRLVAVAGVVASVLGLGLVRLLLPSRSVDARVIDVRLLQSQFESASGERRESRRSWQRRQMQRWSPK